MAGVKGRKCPGSGIYPRTKEHIKNWLKSRKGYRHSLETKKKIGEGLKKAYKDGRKNGFQKGNNSFLNIKGKNHPAWKGGKVYSVKRYILIYAPTHPFVKTNNYVWEHRLIIEKQIGRYLLPTEVCHHINGIKDDNRLQNLMAFVNRSSHQKFECNKKIDSSNIIFDGRRF